MHEVESYYVEVKAMRPATKTVVTEWVRVPAKLPNGAHSDMGYTLESIVNMIIEENGPGWEACATIKNYSDFEHFLESAP